MRNWCLALIWLASGVAYGDELSWNYTQLSYQKPDVPKVQGISGEMSAQIRGPWILNGEVSYIQDDGDSSVLLSQTRYDLSVGRIFALSERLHLLASAGYTHVEYRERLAGGSDSFGFDAANLQLGVRGRLAERFEANAQLGVLVDEDDVSDLLWEVGLRYHMTRNVAINLAIIGSEEATSSDEVIYELGFRFDMGS